MKNVFQFFTVVILTVSLFFSVKVNAQAPQKMSYQAVVRNSSDQLVVNQSIGMRISILQGSETGTEVYKEIFNPNPQTNQNGLVSIEIGGGIPLTGIFSNIDWTNGPYFVKTETDPTGGTNYTITGVSQLLSIPYALHSKTAETLSNPTTETDPVFGASPANGITGTDITNWNNKLDSEIDGSVTNELQTLSISNDTVYLTNGGFVKLPAGFDGQYSSLTGAPTNVSSFTNDAGYITGFTEIDGSVTNELQTLSISNDTVYLSNGGFVKLPAETDPNAWSKSGNAGTIEGVNFIGTTDSTSLDFRTDSILKIRFTTKGQIETYNNGNSVFIGKGAGENDDLGNNSNVFIGYEAGKTNIHGAYNIAIGSIALQQNISGANNIALGRQSLSNNTIGINNIATGYGALPLNISGSYNISLGSYSMQNNSTGSYNIAIGVGTMGMQQFSNNSTPWNGYNIAIGTYALNGNNPTSLSNGIRNIAIGSYALKWNSTGFNNNAVGDSALYSNTKASQNIAIGNNALKSQSYSNGGTEWSTNNIAIGYATLYNNNPTSNLNGSKNVAVGDSALFSNTIGHWNSSFGHNSLYSNTTGYLNSAFGANSLYLNTTGKSNSAYGTYSMYYNTTGSYNAAFGLNALAGNTVGNSNSAIGTSSLSQNTTASQNIAIGHGALVTQAFNNGGTEWKADNVAIGAYALFTNNPTLITNGIKNTAVGSYSLRLNTIGYKNIAIGDSSAYNNTTGHLNTIVGSSAFKSNTIGYNNVAIGYQSLYSNTTSSNNTACGFESMYSNVSGVSNTAYGAQSLYNTTAYYNTAIGYRALYENTTGYNNTALGFAAFSSGDNYMNSTAIGFVTSITASNQVRIGNSSVTSIGGQVAWTTVSDSRFKKAIQENVPGLDFIMNLKPVTYNLDLDKIAEFLNTPDELRLKDAEKIKGEMLQTGFIAQDVEAAAKSLGFDFSGVDIPKNENDFYGLRYAEFTVPLVKAVQEQQKMIELQKNDIELLKNENAELKIMLKKINDRLENSGK